MPDAKIGTAGRSRGPVLVMAAFLLVAPLLPALADQEEEYLKAAESVLCDCGCHPQSVAACACGRAAELREEMRAMVAGGMNGDEVIATYVAKHGEQILIAPDAEGFNLVAWIGPIALLFGGVGGLFLLVRRWSARAASETLPSPATELAPDDPYVNKLRRELEEMQ